MSSPLTNVSKEITDEKFNRIAKMACNYVTKSDYCLQDPRVESVRYTPDKRILKVIVWAYRSDPHMAPMDGTIDVFIEMKGDGSLRNVTRKLSWKETRGLEGIVDLTKQYNESIENRAFNDWQSLSPKKKKEQAVTMMMGLSFKGYVTDEALRQINSPTIREAFDIYSKMPKDEIKSISEKTFKGSFDSDRKTGEDKMLDAAVPKEIIQEQDLEKLFHACYDSIEGLMPESERREYGERFYKNLKKILDSNNPHMFFAKLNSYLFFVGVVEYARDFKSFSIPENCRELYRKTLRRTLDAVCSTKSFCTGEWGNIFRSYNLDGLSKMVPEKQLLHDADNAYDRFFEWRKELK